MAARKHCRWCLSVHVLARVVTRPPHSKERGLRTKTKVQEKRRGARRARRASSSRAHAFGVPNLRPWLFLLWERVSGEKVDERRIQ